MNSKKIIVIISLAFLSIAITGYTCAIDAGYIGGANPERGVVIEGIEFNIPDGYVENTDKSVVNQSNRTDNITYVYNQKTFENSDGEEIILTVVNYDDFDVDKEMLKRICEGLEEKEMMGYSGYINQMDNFTQFAYNFNNNAVSITAPNENIINQILVVEDS